MNSECLVTEEEGTHPDHGEQDGDGAKDGLRWCDVRDLLHKIKTTDGHVQCRENPVPALRLLGFVGHSRDADGHGKALKRGGHEEKSEPL